jgi:hypothetical protein
MLKILIIDWWADWLARVCLANIVVALKANSWPYS